ncbi:MAG: SBBP repeat-containing protein, partial [Candidatus Acidiferrales bacterium]
PGADARAIALDVQGATKLRVDRRGNLLMKVQGGEVALQKPLMYQDVNGERREIAGNYTSPNNHEVRFAVSDYDRNLPLTIDPVLNYVTYLGGTGTDAAYGIALDAAGDAYVAGTTTSSDFPQQNPESVTPPTDIAAEGTAFVSELNPTGTQLLYSTYLGGAGSANGGDFATAIAVDAATPLNIYVTGYTYSPDFPISTNALITTPGPAGTSTGGSGFVTKLTPSLTGSAQLAYSTYLGGDTLDQGNGIAVDATGDAFVTGLTESTNFPTTTNAYSQTLLNPNGSIFLTEINTVSGADVYSTYFGGTLGTGNAFLYGDEAFGLTIDASSNAYVVGTTTSSDFPTAGHTVSSCATDANGIAFVSVINTNTPALTYSTCLGGATTETQGQAIALGPSNIAYVTGQTTSSDFPVTANSIPAPGGAGAGVVFVSLLNTSSATPNTYSTFLGGTNGDFPFGIAADSTGNAYVAGFTGSADFPITQGAILQTRNNGNGTGFVSKISPGGKGLADLLYSTYFGGNGSGGTFDSANGIAITTANNAYITGQAASSNLPVTSGVYQSTFTSTTSNAFVADLPLLASITYTPTSIDFGTQLVGSPTAAQVVTLTNNTASAITLTPPALSFTGANPGDFSVDPNTTTCTASLPASPARCTYGLIFTPSINGAESATFNVFDGADTVAHPIQVALTGNGSNTVAGIAFSPTSLTFAGQLLTTTSAAQTLTVSNPSTTTALTISAINVSTSDFTIASNSCGNLPITILPSPAGVACMLSITFNPSATTAPGADNGTITFTDNANGSPQSYALSGTAWDFSVTGPASANLKSGVASMIPITITGLGGFNGTVSLSCTGSANVTSCTIPSSSAPGMVNATVTATRKSLVVQPEAFRIPPASVRQVVFVMLGFGMLFMIPAARRYRTRLGLAGAMLVFVVVAGCTGTPPPPVAGSITVTGSVGTLTRTATVTLSISK